MAKSLILAAAIAAAGIPASPPDSPRGAVGDWRLSDVSGKLACTLTLSGERGRSGFVVRAPLACRRGFPLLKDLAAWSLDPQGAIVFSDPAQRRIAVFSPQPGAPFEAKITEGKVWRLEPSRATRLQSPRERMTGAFRLSGPGGAVLCDLQLTANLFGTAGAVTPVQCAPPWGDRNLTSWSFREGRLTLFDKARKPLLVLKTDTPTTFVASDPKADAVVLARK